MIVSSQYGSVGDAVPLPRGAEQDEPRPEAYRGLYNIVPRRKSAELNHMAQGEPKRRYGENDDWVSQ